MKEYLGNAAHWSALKYTERITSGEGEGIPLSRKEESIRGEDLPVDEVHRFRQHLPHDALSLTARRTPRVPGGQGKAQVTRDQIRRQDVRFVLAFGCLHGGNGERIRFVANACLNAKLQQQQQ